MINDYRSPITTNNEDRERDLNRNRADEQHHAWVAGIARLRDRGINADDASSIEAVADVLDAVETFELAVEANGGDLMIDTPPAIEPDDPRFVLPRRHDDESLAAYTSRIRIAASQLAEGLL